MNSVSICEHAKLNAEKNFFLHINCALLIWFSAPLKKFKVYYNFLLYFAHRVKKTKEKRVTRTKMMKRRMAGWFLMVIFQKMKVAMRMMRLV